MNVQLSSLTPLLGAAPQTKSPEKDRQPATTFHEILSRATTKTDKVSDTAKQFEALVVGQVLKAAREASQGGWLGGDSDETGELTLEMAEQGFAQALAARGAMGIAKLVTPMLRRAETTPASSDPSQRILPSRDSSQ
jgi:flagellar protein FlgJ